MKNLIITLLVAVVYAMVSWFALSIDAMNFTGLTLDTFIAMVVDSPTELMVFTATNALMVLMVLIQVIRLFIGTKTVSNTRDTKQRI